MSDTYLLDGSIPVTMGSLLGSGGYAQVYAGTGDYTTSAFKVWLPTAYPSEADYQLAVKKVMHAIKTPLPRNAYKPLQVITDRHGRVKGFRMDQYPLGYIPIDSLADRLIWEAYDFNQSHVVRVFLNLHDYHTELHEVDALVGDGNPNNFDFLPTAAELPILGGDIDAYHFGPNMPSTAGQVNFVAPTQYGLLPDRLRPIKTPALPNPTGAYTAADDWWTFMINFIRSLFRIDPYKPKPDEADERHTDMVMAGLHVLNPSRPYPPIRNALPLRSVADKYLNFFASALSAKQVPMVPRGLLEGILDDFLVCSNHPVPMVYSRSRNECPHCAKDRTIPAFTVNIEFANFVIKLVFQPDSQRQTVFAKTVQLSLSEQAIVIISRQGNKMLVTYLGSKGVLTESALPCSFSPTQSYSANGKYVAVGEGAKVTLYSPSGAVVSTFHTETYMKNPVFGLTADKPMWMIANGLTSGEDFLGRMLPQLILNLQYGNVWFDSSPFADVTVGFINWLNGYEWFVIRGQTRTAIDLPFQPGEFISKWRVIFAPDGFAIARRSQVRQQAEETKVTVFDTNLKRLYEETFASTIPLESFALANGTLLVSTESGVSRREAKGTGMALMAGTENVTTARILAVNGKRIIVGDDGKIYSIVKA
jgi:hypothetical protein